MSDFIVPSRKLSGGGFQHIVDSLNGLTGDIQFVPGANMAISVSGNILTLSSTTFGTVNSVGLTAPGSVFNVSGSPITGTGTLSLSFANQASATVFAGPTSGYAAPSFRALTAGDIPQHNLLTAHNVTGLTTNTFLRATGATSVGFTILYAADLPSHTHAASDVISGALTLSRGGTGASMSVPSSSKIFYYDTGNGGATWLGLGSNLSVTSDVLNVASGSLSLSSSSNLFDVNGDLWMASNAIWDGVNWDRVNVGKTSFALYLGGTNNFPNSSSQGASLWVAAPSSNPINATYGSEYGWCLGWEVTPALDFVVGGNGVVIQGGGAPYGRLVSNTAFSTTFNGIATNLSTNFSTRDIGTDPSWFVGMEADSFTVSRIAGSAAINSGDLTPLLRVSNTGNAVVAGTLTATGGLQIPSAAQSASGDTILVSANTFYDGPSVTLAAGTWFVTATVTMSGAQSGTNDTAKIWDGASNIAASGQHTTDASGAIFTMTLSGLIILGASTSIKVSVATTDTSGAHRIKAAASANSAGNTASTIAAIRVA